MSYAGNGDDIQMHERIFAQVLGVDESEEFATELTYYASELLHILPPGWELVIGENDLAGIPMFVYSETQETEWNHPYESEYRRKIIAKRNELHDKYANNNASFNNNGFNNMPNEGSFQMSNFNASSIESNFDQSIGGLDAEAVSEVGFDSARAGGSDGGIMDPAASLEDHEIVFAQMLGVDLEERHFLVLAFLAKELMRILPEGWELLTSVSNTGVKVPYYFDPVTKSSHWTHPYENQYKDVIARKRAELQSAEPPTPLDSARSKASDGSSINSIDRLALIEAMFAGALGVNPMEEYASELNDYARELLQTLPPGWEVVVADTGKSTDAFPLFVNNNDGSNTLDHPLLAEHTRSIDEMRNALQFGVLPSEFLSRTSPRSVAGAGAGASAEPSVEFLAQQAQRAADEEASRAAAVAAAELQARIAAAERAAAEQAAAEELAAQQAAERAAAEEATRLEEQRAEQARIALIEQERLAAEQAAAEQAAAEVARLTAEKEAAEAAATALREAQELERLRLLEIQREQEQREQELLAAKIVAEREAAEREAAQREAERLRAEQEAFVAQEELRLKQEQEQAQAALLAAELLAQQEAAELARIQALELAKRIEKEQIAARAEEEKRAQEQAEREATEAAEALRKEQDARAQQEAQEQPLQVHEAPAPQPAEGSTKAAESTPPIATEEDSNDNAARHDAPSSSDSQPSGPADTTKEADTLPSDAADQKAGEESAIVEGTVPGEHSVVSAVVGEALLDAPSEVSAKEVSEKVATQAAAVDESLAAASEQAGGVTEPDAQVPSESPSEVQAEAPTEVPTAAETITDTDAIIAEGFAAASVEDEVARELSEEVAASTLVDQQAAIDTESAAVSEGYIDETIAKLATHAAREAFEEATADKAAADKLAAERTSAELRAARAAEKLAAEQAAQALIEKEIADQAALEVAATSLFEQELQLARQASSERLLSTERAGDSSVQALDLEPDMLSQTMPSEGLFTVAEGPESPDSGRLSVPELGTGPPAAPPAPADSFDMNAIQSNVIKLETQYLDAKSKDVSKRRTSKRVSTPEGQSIIVPKDPSKYQDELAASREEGPSDSEHEATGKGKSKSLRPLSKVSPKKEAARRRRAASTLLRSPTPGSKSPSRPHHQERLWEVRVEPDQAEKTVAGIRWHTLGCYTSYDDAVKARKTIMKIVTGDSQGTILFDPRTDISDYDLTAALQATINPQPAVPMVTTTIAGYVSVSPSRAATASGAVKPWPGGMSGLFSPSRPSTSANLSNTAASFSPPFTPGAGTMRSAMSASGTGRPNPAGATGTHALPAATDTREMIIGRVKRQTEKLSKLRVRKDLGRMQWVLETDDIEVSKITDRHRKKKGVDIEGKSEDAVKVKAKNALRVMQKARETEETVEMKTLKRLPAMEELIEADLMQVLATSKSFGDFSLTSKLVAEERRLKEELTARLAKLGKRHESSPTKRAGQDRDREDKAAHKPRKAGPVTNRIPESNGKSSSVKLTLPEINSRR